MRVPVLAVRLQAGDQVTGPRLHGDGLVIHGDDVGGDVRPVAVGLVPLQEEAGGGGVARLRGGGELQEGEGGDRFGVGRRGPEAHLLAVRTAAGLVHRLRRRQRNQRSRSRTMKVTRRAATGIRRTKKDAKRGRKIIQKKRTSGETKVKRVTQTN